MSIREAPIRRVQKALTAAALLALAACGRPPEEAVPGSRGAPAPSVADFERSSFYRKHPPQGREAEAAGIAYRMSDPYGESGSIRLTLAPAERVRAITVSWQTQGRPAAWSSIKKQFLADLLESTFWDVDYGRVSSYVMEQQRKGTGADVVPSGMPGDVTVTARFSGPELVLTLTRPGAE